MNNTQALTETSPLDAAVAKATEAYELATADTSANIASALAAARAIAILRRQFTPPVVAELKELAGKSLGFRTDRDGKGAYSDAQLVECALEAGLRGLPFVGDCWNIIQGRVYVTKIGLKTLIRRMTQVSNFQYSIGLPKKGLDGAVADCAASWSANGTPRKLEAAIPVRTDQYTTVDALIGKIERRFLARCYEQMCNRAVPEGDVESPGDLSGIGPAIEVSAPKFFEAPAATPQVVNVGPQEDPLAEPPAPAQAPAQAAPPAIAPADMPVAPKRRPGRPPKAPAPAAPAPPPAPEPVAPPPSPEPPPESDPDDPAPEPPEPAPKPLNLRGTGAVPVERPSQIPEGEVTLPMFRRLLGELRITEAEFMAHLVKKHGLPKNVDNIEQLALVRAPLWNWVRSNPQTAVDQAAFSLGKAGVV